MAQPTLTIADLRLYQLHTWLSGSFGACLHGERLDGMPKEILNGFPLLELHKERVEETSDVMAFRGQFPWPYATFNFNPDEASEQHEEVGSAYPLSNSSEMPRLTLTHAEETLNVEPIRLAAAIGKVRWPWPARSPWYALFAGLTNPALPNSCRLRTKLLNRKARNGRMFTKDASPCHSSRFSKLRNREQKRSSSSSLWQSFAISPSSATCIPPTRSERWKWSRWWRR